VFERLLSKPTIEGQNILRIVPRVHEIAGMHQNISSGKILYPVVESVGVGNYHDTHQLTSLLRPKNASRRSMFFSVASASVRFRSQRSGAPAGARMRGIPNRMALQ
jgi:hypothetical protein